MPTKKNQDLLDLRYPSDKKASKPLMEKRRRARINHSLAQLKALVIDPSTTERSRQTKLEKADILDLTVRHLNEIKRQQRTAFLLETKHPKKKFEIGYAECAREVELFLSNLISPESSGVDLELQKRLQEHLNKRLQDFKDIEPLDVSSKKEASEDEVNDDPSSSTSSAVFNSVEDLPLSADTEETDSPDSSALNKMLNYYSEDKNILKRENAAASVVENLSPKRLKKFHTKSNEEDRGISFSCQAVTSTTECRSSDTCLGPSRSANYFEKANTNTTSETHCVKKCFATRSESSDFPNLPRVIPTKPTMDKKTHLHKSPHLKIRDQNYSSCVSSVQNDEENKSRQTLASTRTQKFTEQIPLVPRQLANGDWALVLPASLVPTTEGESYPFSAFKLVVPTNSMSPDLDADFMKQRLHSSSPLSSTVSDMSFEEFFSTSDGDSVERMDHNSPDSTQVVWRPW